MIRRLDSKPCCKAQQLLRGYDRLRLPQPHVHANRRNKASPFMTGPFVPVRILNPIRAVVGIPHHRFNLFVKCSNTANCDMERRLAVPTDYRNGVSSMRSDSDIRRDVEGELRWDPDID